MLKAQGLPHGKTALWITGIPQVWKVGAPTKYGGGRLPTLPSSASQNNQAETVSGDSLFVPVDIAERHKFCSDFQKTNKKNTFGLRPSLKISDSNQVLGLGSEALNKGD